MFKTAVLFAAGSVALAIFAPDLLTRMVATSAPMAAPPRPAAPAPSPFVERAAVGPVTHEREIAIPADGLGQYSTNVMLNGQSVHMLIDTGASLVFVSAAVADRIGLVPPSNAQRVPVRTANGAAMATLVTLNSVAIGPVYVPGVQALIADRSAGDVNLVGASLLSRLGGVEQRSGYLYLRQ